MYFHDDSAINGFQGEYRFLSNFWPAPTMFEGVLYPSSENAYQSAKCLDIKDIELFKSVTPAESKRLGKIVLKRPDWDRIKLDVMTAVNVDKYYRNLNLRAMLLATGNKTLIEANTWGDVFWGVCDGKGENHLGQILMKVRALWDPSSEKMTDTVFRLF